MRVLVAPEGESGDPEAGLRAAPVEGGCPWPRSGAGLPRSPTPIEPPGSHRSRPTTPWAAQPSSGSDASGAPPPSRRGRSRSRPCGSASTPPPPPPAPAPATGAPPPRLRRRLPPQRVGRAGRRRRDPDPGRPARRVRRSKTDQEGRGRDVGIPTGAYPTTCPVRALQAWRAQAGITAGPLCRPVDRWDRVGPGHLAGRAVGRVVQRGARRAGLDPRGLAGHSLRAGLATAAVTVPDGATVRAWSAHQRTPGRRPGSRR